MEVVLGFLARPEIRYIMTMVGGFLMKSNPAFFNKAIPAATLGLNIVVVTLASLFGVEVAQASAGSFFAAAFPTLLDVLVPWVGGHGTHNIVKNGVVEWKKAGFKFSVSR
jgi:hypothetical protein